MQTTTNYGLKKPEGNEFVSVADLNYNADEIDKALKGLDNDKVDASGGDIANTKVSEFTNSNTQWPVPAAGEEPKTLWGKVKKFIDDFKNWMTGVCLIGQIVNNCVTDNAKLPLSAAQGKVLMDLYTVLNTKQNQVTNGIWSGNKVLAIRYGNTPISSNIDGSFQLNHNAGLTDYMIFARFGSSSSQDFITFGGIISNNAAYGIVHSSDGSPKQVTSTAILWMVIGYLT